jgi:hypothetical protein
MQFDFTLQIDSLPKLILDALKSNSHLALALNSFYNEIQDIPAEVEPILKDYFQLSYDKYKTDLRSFLFQTYPQYVKFWESKVQFKFATELWNNLELRLLTYLYVNGEFPTDLFFSKRIALIFHLDNLWDSKEKTDLRQWILISQSIAQIRNLNNRFAVFGFTDALEMPFVIPSIPTIIEDQEAFPFVRFDMIEETYDYILVIHRFPSVERFEKISIDKTIFGSSKNRPITPSKYYYFRTPLNPMDSLKVLIDHLSTFPLYYIVQNLPHKLIPETTEKHFKLAFKNFEFTSLFDSNLTISLTDKSQWKPFFESVKEKLIRFLQTEKK